MSDDSVKIGDYVLERPLTTDDSGFSRWGIGKKNGERYFIKEFLSPVYPSDDCGLSESIIASRRRSCAAFYRQKLALYAQLARCQTGNIVWVEQCFRYGPRYYAVSEYIDAIPDPVGVVSRTTEVGKRVILRLLSYNIAVLHSAGVIHADLKPNNIMLRATSAGAFTAKLIDFDASFLVSDPPQASDDVHGDLVYLAPEVFLRMRDEAGELTDKLDVFSLGVLFHELWTGAVPGFDRSRFSYPFEAVLNGAPLRFDRSLPPDVHYLIARMLALRPEDRPSAADCFAALGGALVPKASAASPPADPRAAPPLSAPSRGAAARHAPPLNAPPLRPAGNLGPSR